MGTNMGRGCCLGFLGLLMAGAFADGAEWLNWRGPNHDGISAETGFKTTWTSPPKVRWERKIGSAFSSFACADGKVYTCGTENKKQILFCLDADNGKLVWRKPFEEELKDHQGGDGTRATPTIDEGRVYVFGARGLLLCLDAENGEEIWNKTFNNKPKWAYAGSVLIESDLAIVSAGKSDGALVALNKKTGGAVWKCGDDQAGYATPYPFTFKGKRYIAGFLGRSVIIAEAKTGREVWSMPWKTSYDVNASAPIYHDGHLFLSSGYKHGCILLKLGLDGDKLSAEEVWQSDVLRNRFQSCVLYDGSLYSGDEDALKCVDFMTGRELWRKDRAKYSSVLLAGGHLIVLTEKGKLQISKISPKAFKPIAEADVLSGRCWTIPALYDGRLYLRNLEKAICLDLRKRS